ncbi:hypothetical protein QKW60_09715 [Defluviimonas aestuarii]|uniref:hypothetical protein n=1 Tax=Albidovulum aestuarii TaxID=1130726 RepID=UPI00249BD574|nr:hypothetical protein [Defluviimonas aestuarii]MDI3336683.1 hypothetical protein [Defluviimonas aestuarii]
MTIRLLTALALVTSLPGCAGVIVADASKNESRAAIAKVMAEERPGIDAEAAGKCVQKAMTLVETVQLGTADNYKSVSTANRERIRTYAARAEAVACLDALPVTEEVAG